jgi:hypothetical protein
MKSSALLVVPNSWVDRPHLTGLPWSRWRRRGLRSYGLTAVSTRIILSWFLSLALLLHTPSLTQIFDACLSTFPISFETADRMLNVVSYLLYNVPLRASGTAACYDGNNARCAMEAAVNKARRYTSSYFFLDVVIIII